MNPFDGAGLLNLCAGCEERGMLVTVFAMIKAGKVHPARIPLFQEACKVIE